MSLSQPSLLILPREIRACIYHYVFEGAQITLEQQRVQPINTPIHHAYRNSSFRADLLCLCKGTRSEIFPVLASNTTLLLSPGLSCPNEAIKIIPSIWLAHIRTVLNTARVRSRITHVLRQEHLDPSLFTRLQLYRVAHLVYPDWRDSCHKTEDIESFIQSHLESDFFFQANTLRLFTRARTYALTVTLWLLRAFVEESVGWEVEFSLDSWSIIRKRKARFIRHKDVLASLWDDPKCRDYRNYDVVFLDE